MWVKTVEKEKGKNIIRVYCVENGVAVHRSKKLSVDELKKRSISWSEFEDPFSLLCRHYILCLKKANETRQRKFEVRYIPISGVMFAECMDIETFELATLQELIDEGYTSETVVSVLTSQERNKIRAFQRYYA